jgi:hypothetical protein
MTAQQNIELATVSQEVSERFCNRPAVPMSESGRVSRGSPVQTALRNCTRDEGRSFEAGSQVLASNRCKLLLSKAMVVSVEYRSRKVSRAVNWTLPSLRRAMPGLPFECVSDHRCGDLKRLRRDLGARHGGYEA